MVDPGSLTVSAIVGLIVGSARKAFIDPLISRGVDAHKLNKEVRTVVITNISEAKARLSALIEKVRAGQEVIIGKAGRPVAKLVRYERSEEPRRPGALRGKIKIADDFDDLPAGVAEAFGMVDQ